MLHEVLCANVCIDCVQVGQAGRPKTITGFQTHTTPVLLGHNDRAELATDDCTCSFSYALFVFFLLFIHPHTHAQHTYKEFPHLHIWHNSLNVQASVVFYS